MKSMHSSCIAWHAGLSELAGMTAPCFSKLVRNIARQACNQKVILAASQFGMQTQA